MNGAFDPALVGVCGRSLVLIGGRPGLDVLGGPELSTFVPVRMEEGAALLVCVLRPASCALISAVSASTPLLREEYLSGLVLELLPDFPG